MGLFDRWSRGTATAGDEVRSYLTTWTRSRTGVEAFVEPKTTVTDVTVVLVAADGEWTRRVVGERGARRLARDLQIPVYDVRKTGYPQRMRDHDERQRILRRRERGA
ncbi:oxidoreductase [Skermania sp. ID1734]|uniref:oxidoreductase n=1 Tax=Skermania sp. ID1734 TaxID=2597516 RepID=UPI0011807BB6|nr:oxidoreductase [Skermania sp. ID1734]TSE01167.1 oxidoreductase [Skermania sp. ID1734]